MRQFFLCKAAILLFGLFAVFLPSCTARIDGSLSADRSMVLSVNMSLGTRMAALIRSLSAAGGQADAPVLDAPSIARSMSGAPGVASVTLRNTSTAAIEGQVRISQISEFLSAADGRGFITFQNEGGAYRMEININRVNGPSVIELLSSDVSDYLNALMAPIASGEEITRSEYLELISSFYNRGISDEIASSRIRSSIEFPGAITGIRGGTFSGRRASFDIPLLDLLVLETPLIYEVNWR